ncbi:MAG: SGNH/GDSL hydrolase family protein, partial [Nitrospinae bacterium]|nr:SGNH/GDSL hydrolase family protein [Nitrospinota bacterium]
MFSLIAIVTFFASIEAGLQLSGYQPKIKLQSFDIPAWVADLDPVTVEEYKEDVARRGFVNEDVYAYRPHPDLNYLLKPNIRFQVKNYLSGGYADKLPPWTIVSGPDGFRVGGQGTEIAPEGVPLKTVHVFGDSSSFGWGVDYEETYGYVVERELNRARRRDGMFYVLENHAIPGFTSFQGRLLANRIFADRVRPGDLVLVSFGYNDATPSSESDRKRFEKQNSSLGKLRWALSRFLLYRVLKSFFIGRDWAGAAPLTDTALPRVSSEEYRENLRAIFDSVLRRGGDPVFISVCNYVYSAAAQEVAETYNVPFISFPEEWEPFLPQASSLLPEKFRAYRDSYGDLMNVDDYLSFMFPDYCHPYSIGHRLIAEVVGQVLGREFALD